jgi:hypothetical protein
MGGRNKLSDFLIIETMCTFKNDTRQVQKNSNPTTEMPHWIHIMKQIT